jgi:hypothetical protein
MLKESPKATQDSLPNRGKCLAWVQAKSAALGWKRSQEQQLREIVPDVPSRSEKKQLDMWSEFGAKTIAPGHPLRDPL